VAVEGRRAGRKDVREGERVDWKVSVHGSGGKKGRKEGCKGRREGGLEDEFYTCCCPLSCRAMSSIQVDCSGVTQQFQPST